MSIPFLEQHQEADILRDKFHALPFIQSMYTGELNQTFIHSFLDCLYVENFLFVLEMAKMRINFCKHPAFIIDFLDPHTMTEFGAKLNAVGLKAQRATHYEHLINFAKSYDYQQNSPLKTTSVVSRMSLQGMSFFSDQDLAFALGALYADEVYAYICLPVFYHGFLKYNELTGVMGDLTFLKIHALESEPAHIKHAKYLFDYVEQYGLSIDRFKEGYTAFMSTTLEKFSCLDKTLSH